MGRIYDRSDWRQLARDGECVGPELLGGACSGLPHLHHLDEDGGRLLLLCARHHAALHGARRRLERRRVCRHRHFTLEAKHQCERRLNAA